MQLLIDIHRNPYIEEQAIDRAHRLGQTKEVKVQRILVAETVEDRIIALQEKKRALISEALDEKAGQNIARLGVRVSFHCERPFGPANYDDVGARISLRSISQRLINHVAGDRRRRSRQPIDS